MRRYLPGKLKHASRFSMLPNDTEPPRNMSIVDPGEVNHIIKELNPMDKPSS
jgi:hypothetical protein